MFKAANYLPPKKFYGCLLTSIRIIVALLPFSLHAQATIPTAEPIIKEGKTLFENNCTVCHAIHEEIVGPALAGVYDRRPIPWLNAFIKNSQKVIQSGDTYAVQLYEKYNRMQMTSFDLSEDQVLAILAYIKDATENAPEPTVAPSEKAVAGGGAAEVERAIPDKYLLAIFIALIIVLLLILLVLILIVTFLTKLIRQKGELDEADEEIVAQKINLKKIIQSKAFKGIAVFIFTAIVLKAGIDGLYAVGIQQGYAPRQPIDFSHKLHAGEYQIACEYCHTGVTKSKIANIPSPNICMNCHSVIEKAHPEVQKIYAAIENNTPIEWVRVHNLPQLAYFNHAQHVKVGGIECQTCHGPVEEMEVIYQYAPLTMGWCIDCHRKTAINAKDNAYYDKLIQLHESKHNDLLKVEAIGGLECGKCHY